jgi:hypothetical protein
MIADMFHTLRTLLIALAAASPLLSGLQLVAADPFPPTVLRSADPTSFDGSREDDAGTVAEQCEEDDTEQEQCRVLAMSSASASASHDDDAVRRVAMSTGSLAEISRPRLHLSRGPPSRR